MARIVITGWSSGFNASVCTQLLRSSAGLSPADARRVTEGVLNGRQQEFQVRSGADAHLLISALQRIGASARIESP